MIARCEKDRRDGGVQTDMTELGGPVIMNLLYVYIKCDNPSLGLLIQRIFFAYASDENRSRSYLKSLSVVVAGYFHD